MSVYQVDGRQLSQQALYQQKLRQGVFNSPGAPSIGVSSSASDAAALLAASSDLTVKPSFERLKVAPEAQTAALAAKSELKAAWSRGKPGALADAAAASAQTPEKIKQRESELGIPVYNLGKVFRAASASATSTMTSRTTPEKSVGRHGLASTSSTSSGLNIGKISALADKNSSQLLDKRFNPEQDYRLGVKTAPPTRFLTAEEEKLAADLAGRSLTMKHGAGYTDSVSSVKRTKTFQAADVVDATLLAAANKRANERLQSILSTGPADLREQAQLYAKALTAAQKKSEERLKSHKAGLIDLGGGLQLPYSEIDKLATLIVTPVLADITSKAAAQRESDSEKLRKFAELTKLHQAYKTDDYKRRQKEKAEREQEKLDRIKANEERKVEQDKLYEEHQTTRNGEVDERTEEFKALQEKYDGEKAELLKEKLDNEERILEEETGLIDGRKEELEKMQTERDEELKPTLDELDEEKKKLKDLKDSEAQATEETESSEKQKSEYETKIAELKEKLEKTEEEIEAHIKEVEETTSKREALGAEVDELKGTSATEIETAEKEDADLKEKIAELEEEKLQHIETKALHKKEILSEIDEKVKDETKINNELPEHLRDNVDEKKIRDTSSIFTKSAASIRDNASIKESPAAHAISPPSAPSRNFTSTATQAATERKHRIRTSLLNIKSKFRLQSGPNEAVSSPSNAPAKTAAPVVKPTESTKVEAAKVESKKLDDDFVDVASAPKKEGGLFKEEI